MNLEEAIKALKEGKKIRRKAWPMSIGYLLKDGNYITLNDKDFRGNDWEVVEENILNKHEKEYLKNLIKPFIKEFNNITIKKRKSAFSSDRLFILIIFSNDDSFHEIMLPYFAVDDHMYTGMEADKSYTLEELGLFEEERK